MTYAYRKGDFAPLEFKDAGGADDPLKAIKALGEMLESKLGLLDGDLKKVRDHIDAEIAKLKRPNAETKSDAAIEKKAYETFIRKGIDGLTAEERKSIRSSDDVAGGYLAPDQFVTELDRNVVLFSPVRQVARVMPIGTGAAVWPKRTGGMTGQWVGEGQPRPETTVTFGQSRYEVREFAAYVDVSNNQIEDNAFDVSALLAYEFGEEFGKAEGTAFVNGASSLSPAGYMQNASVGYTAGGHASNITADGLIDLYHSVPSPYRAQAVWMLNSTTLSAIRKLKDGTGNYLVLTAGLAGQVTTTILGRPVVEAPDMPNVASDAYPIAFGDFNQAYRIFDRVPIAILRDPFTQATNGMVRFHGRRRVAGGVGKAEAIRKLKIATS